MNNNHPNTLFSLLNEYRVLVPVVQRDYAQGRTDEHSCFVRENLLNDLKNYYENNSICDPLDLNFVYGKLENDEFIPVDGQQRLTTLFLLHLFAFSDDDSKDNLLKRFSYESRKTTKDFLLKLIENRKEVFNSKLKPSAEILDSEWLNISWSHDPSVLSMLKMLDDIVAKRFDKENLRIQLLETNNPRVVFKFLDLENIDMEDDLYIKLNARGRALTLFENFKSSFVTICEKKCNHDVFETIKQNLDGIWADLFWSFIEKTNTFNLGEENDKLYLKFFSYVFCNNMILNTNKSVIIPQNWIFSIDYNSISKDTIKLIYNTLNYVAFSKKYSDIIKECLNDKDTFENRVIIHAVTKFLSNENDPKSINEKTFDDWYRIIHNLIVNTNIDRHDRYINALNAINNLSVYKDRIIEYLSTKDIKISGFDGFQFEEECKKARIIKQNTCNRDAIIEAEKKLSYFNGQISCALNISNFEITGDKAQFQNYVNKISYMFDPLKNEAKYSNELQRALFTLGDYTILVDNKYNTLCINDPNESSRTRSFKYLFSHYKKEVETIINNIDLNSDLLEQYENYINKSTILQNDWRYCFINYPFLFSYMSKSHYRFFKMNNDAIMVPNKASSGYNYSVYLKVLERELKNNNKQYKYYSDFGQYGNRYLVNDNNSVKVTFKNGAFIINNIGIETKISGSNLITDALNHLLNI